MSPVVYIRKSSGEKELFDREKLRTSLRRSGASTVLANEIADKVEAKITTNSSTAKIYQTAFDLLKKQEHKTAMRYSLRRSLFAIGPSGFPFEKYVAKILEKKGYKTETGIMLKGKCIEHEIDILAYDDDDLILIEAKFHNELFIKSDTKVALYVKARYDDLSNSEFDVGGRKRKLTSGVLLTNTKFTNTAKQYAKCAGLELISWDYPKKGNLYDLIETTGIYPLTCLPSLSVSNRQKLAEAGIINCADVSDNVNLLKELGIPEPKINKILEEVNLICRI